MRFPRRRRNWFVERYGRWGHLATLGFVAVALLVVVVAINVVEAVTQRHIAGYRPDTATGETLGLDVSHHQGPIDWQAVAGDGISFAYIKSTEGGDWVDHRFVENWDGALAAGLDVGAYHFFTLCRTGADQAANFLRTVPAGADLAPAVDLEFAMNCSDRPEPELLREQLRIFIAEVEEATGREVLLYVEDIFDEQYGILDEFDNPTWVRSLRKRPEGERWIFWQANDAAAVDGVDGGVDLNLLRPR